VREATVKRRQKYEDFLSRVPILQELDSYERNKLSDVLLAEVFDRGDLIIRQGEAGDKLYFIEEGEAEAIQMQGSLASSEAAKRPWSTSTARTTTSENSLCCTTSRELPRFEWSARK